MKEKIKKYLMVLTMVVGMLFSAVIPAFANTSEEKQTEENNLNTGRITGNMGVETEDMENVLITEEPSNTEKQEQDKTHRSVQGTTFSVPGNGQLVNDLTDDESKQFLTIQTKNGNTFFMVLDRSNNTENVYMLSMIDENDLAEFIEETEKKPKQEQPSVVIPEIEKPTVQDETKVEEPEEKKVGMSAGVLFLVIVLLVGGIGSYYYFKVLKPRQYTNETDGEDLEFYDGGAYVNEDQDDSNEEEEEK